MRRWYCLVPQCRRCIARFILSARPVLLPRTRSPQGSPFAIPRTNTPQGVPFVIVTNKGKSSTGNNKEKGRTNKENSQLTQTKKLTSFLFFSLLFSPPAHLSFSPTNKARKLGNQTTKTVFFFLFLLPPHLSFTPTVQTTTQFDDQTKDARKKRGPSDFAGRRLPPPYLLQPLPARSTRCW